MAVCGRALFTAADGTALNAYSPDSGTFTKHTSASGASNPVVINNRLRAAVNGDLEHWYFTDAPTSAADPVTATMRLFSGTGLVDLWVRTSTTERTGYTARWFSGLVTFYRWNAGTPTQVGASKALTWDTGTDKTFRFYAVTNGSQVDLTVEIDGLVFHQESDTHADRVTATGRLGFSFFETDTPGAAAGTHIDSIQGGRAIVLTSPGKVQVFQRGATGRADIVITGTYDDGTPTAIEASWNGGAYTTIDASPAAGSFSGTLANQSAGQGTLTVRYTNDTSKSESVAYVGVGEVFAIAGQSNAAGWGTEEQSYSHATLKAGMLGNDYVWKELQSITDSSIGQVDAVSDDGGGEGHSYWLSAATDLLAGLSVPVAFIPCAKGGSTITEWQPGVDHQDRTTLYGSMIYRINQAGGVRAVLWHQGEAEAFLGTSAASYQASLEAIADAIREDVDCPLMACLLQNSTALTDADEDEIRNGTSAAATANANIYLGPDLSDITSDDGFHIQTDAKLIDAGERWAAALLASDLFDAAAAFRLVARLINLGGGGLPRSQSSLINIGGGG